MSKYRPPVVEKEAALTLIAVALAFKSDQFDEFCDPVRVDVWNQYIRQADMFYDLLVERRILVDKAAMLWRCPECDRMYASKQQSNLCAMADKQRDNWDV